MKMFLEDPISIMTFQCTCDTIRQPSYCDASVARHRKVSFRVVLDKERNESQDTLYASFQELAWEVWIEREVPACWTAEDTLSN